MHRVKLKYWQIGMVALSMIAVYLIGARLLFITLYLDLFLKHPEMLFELKLRNFSIYGGLISAGLLWWTLIRLYQLPFYETIDHLMPHLGIAAAISKLGCFFNGCCYGLPTHMPWGVAFKDNNVLDSLVFALLPFSSTVKRHPTQIYEIIAFLTASFVAWYLVHTKKNLRLLR